MTVAIIALMALSIVTACVFTIVRVTHGGVASLLWKTFASFCFVCLGATVAFTYPLGNAGLFLILGLVAGMIGDVLLDLKSVDKTRSNYYLNFGILAFGVGHLLYFVFTLKANANVNVTMPLIVAVTFAALFTLTVLFFSKPILGLTLGKFKWQACGYSFVLSFMSVFAVALIFVSGRMLVFAIAMIAFWISDIVLSVMYFGGKQNNAVLSITNHILYYGAQITIALFMMIM